MTMKVSIPNVRRWGARLTVFLSLNLLVATGLWAERMSVQVASPKIATDLKIKRSITKVKGLLVSGLSNGEFAGTASNLTRGVNKLIATDARFAGRGQYRASVR
ncbi:MAG: hypothetical protein GY953_49035 [bacterium]|nr:hypothetical protein [bacterium]